MLVLTHSATVVINSIVDQSELPTGAGLRITGSGDGREALTIAAAAVPSKTDQIVEEQGAHVFLEPDAAVMLDDKLLDARMDDEGGVKFLLAGQ